MKIPFLALALMGFALSSPALAATDLLRYNLTLDATACGNTEDVTGADSYYIAGTFTAILPDGSARNYSAVTYPFAINDNQQMGYQCVILDDMLPRGTRIYGQMRFYDEDFAKDWNAVSAKFNAAADAGVKAATATGNPTAAAVAGAAYTAFKVFDAVSSGDQDDLLGQVGVSIGDSALAPGGVTKILIKDGTMGYDYNHPARAGIKMQADAAFANKSLVNYYSGDIRFSKSDRTGWSSWAYTQSWFTFIQDPKLDPASGQAASEFISPEFGKQLLAAYRAAEEKKKQALYPPLKLAIKEVVKSPFKYEGDFPKATIGPKPGTGLKPPLGGTGGAIDTTKARENLLGRIDAKIPGGLGAKIPGGLAGKIPGGLAGKLRDRLNGGIPGLPTGTTAGNGAGNGIGGAQNLPANDGAAIFTLPGQLPDGFQFPGANGGGIGGGIGGVTTPNPENPLGETPALETSENGEIDMAGTPVAASKTPMVGKLNSTLAVLIDSKESQDFNLDLPKGAFFVTVDAARVGEGSIVSNSDFSVLILKRNGAEMPAYGGDLIYHNSRNSSTRVGKPFGFTKPTGVRFRIKNDADGANNFWITVTLAAPLKFLPFGFGDKVIAAKIGSNNGTGSVLDSKGHQYLRALIPAGKWSISLGAKSDENCAVDFISLDSRGIDYPSSFSINSVGREERKEKIITLSKPTTLIFRVYNDSGAENVTYDVTIEPSTD